MKLESHQDYALYCKWCEMLSESREALKRWSEEGEAVEAHFFATYTLRQTTYTWTPRSARNLARHFARLMASYNDVIWNKHTFCRECAGKCCRERTPPYPNRLDTVLFALLRDKPLFLPPEIEADAQDCIFRGSSGCLWPKEWRPLPCAIYYCVGDPGWAGERDCMGRWPGKNFWNGFGRFSVDPATPFPDIPEARWTIADYLRDEVMVFPYRKIGKEMWETIWWWEDEMESTPYGENLFVVPGQVKLLFCKVLYQTFLTGFLERFFPHEAELDRRSAFSVLDALELSGPGEPDEAMEEVLSEAKKLLGRRLAIE